MFGGCGVPATDRDVLAVVPERTYKRMLYFRSRDAHADQECARWCPQDGCWELVCTQAPRGSQGSELDCPRCGKQMCFKCEMEVTKDHQCPTQKVRRAHKLLFDLWASWNTKTCPACSCRIQRSHGCSHMTCARCDAYFCWRCRGYLNNGCPPKGRTCVCDRIMTGAAYSGLAAIAIIGAPIIVTGVLIGGGPYLVYRVVRRKHKRRPNDSADQTSFSTSDEEHISPQACTDSEIHEEIDQHSQEFHSSGAIEYVPYKEERVDVVSDCTDTDCVEQVQDDEQTKKVKHVIEQPSLVARRSQILCS